MPFLARVAPALLLLAAACAASACRSPRVFRGGPAGGRPAATPVAPRAAPPSRHVRGGRVQLSPHDLASVDAYFHARNSQWILGDVVDVYASREYFASQLTVNEQVGLVHRSEQELPGETLVTLTYVGRAAPSAIRNPRALIGTGLTVSARKTLRVHLLTTTDTGVPVMLRVQAQGQAARGRKEQTLERAPSLQLGGSLRYASGRWTWLVFG